MRYLKMVIKRIPILRKFVLSGIRFSKKKYMFIINKVMGVNNKKIVFISFNGKSYSDNPRAISEKLHELHPNYEQVWLFNNPEEKKEIVPEYVKCVKANSLRALKELATAKFWVDNFCKPTYTYKSNKQFYIQTWHGDRGFKKVLYDSTFISKESKYIESEICNLAISGSDYADRVYETAFKYTGEILKVGSPRNDILIENDTNKVQDIKEKLNIKENTKVLLYGPTLRRKDSENNSLQPVDEIDWMTILSRLEEKTSNQWVLVYRAHSAVKGLSGISESSNKIINLTEYEDMSELLLITDLLITDYSSSAGDFALLKRPIILLQTDRDEYLKYDRTFYFDMDESPYIIVQDKEELLKVLKDIDFCEIPQNCKDILDFYGTIESGAASMEVVKYIVSKQ